MNNYIVRNMSNEPIRIEDKLEKPEILSTKNYDKFKSLTGNRNLSEGHLFKLTKSILKNNLLAQNPIIVNEKMEVIDGQHRLEIAKNNSLTVYYTVATNASLEDIQILNTNLLAWSGYDYLNSYTNQGKKDYQIAKDWVDEYGITVNNVISILSNDSGDGWRKFKNGQFIIIDLKESEMFLEAYIALKPFTAGQRVWNDRDFVRALRKLFKEISIADFILKLQDYSEKIEHRIQVRDYLREFEEIINYRKKDYTRLF